MAIQMRRGNSADFDPSKMVPGEWAVSQDNQKLYMCFSPGNVVEIGTSSVIELYVQLAEAWAVGEKNGEPVPNTDPTYHNNSKYYSEQAGTSATNAATSETNAGNSALSASGSATTATNKAGEASTSATNANRDALKAEGFAVGEQNGTPVSSGTYYENNSKYYAEKAEEYKDQAAAIVGIGIATTTTPGIVKPDGTSITIDSDGTIHGGAQVTISGKKVIVS